jgi:DNA adenine methylase
MKVLGFARRQDESERGVEVTTVEATVFEGDGDSLALEVPECVPIRPRPFIKWAGGKTRLLNSLLPHVPDQFRDYHEPFLGGGAMFFAVSGRATRTCHLNDLNEELVNAWVVVRDWPTKLRAELRRYARQDSKDFYYSVRPRAPRTPIARAARFIYLNQTSWNGLWRVNRWGEYNVPWGQREFRGLAESTLESLRAVLANTVVQAEDFRVSIPRAMEGDFVYLDPPYLPLSETSKFHLYTERRFRESDLRELASLCEDLSSRGVRWMLSNRDTPLVRKLFSHAAIYGLTARRSVAAQNRRDVERVNSPEVIVVGGPA